MVVEDEPAMSGLLNQALEESGFVVSVAANGSEGLRLAQGHDVLVVDVMMPVMNGFEMVRRLRARGDCTPVIFLTAKDAVNDRVGGLDIGGDDYLVKPFKLAELLARIRALLRRAKLVRYELECADLHLNVQDRLAKRGNRDLALSNTELALLAALMRRHGEIVSKHTILEEVWREEGFRDGNVVEVYINYLRRKLESMGGSRLIHTVRGRGYVLEERDDQP